VADVTNAAMVEVSGGSAGKFFFGGFGDGYILHRTLRDTMPSGDRSQAQHH